LATLEHTVEGEQRSLGKIFTWILRFGLAILIPLIAFFVLYQGFVFLREGNAPKIVIALVAIVWGVGGVAILYYIFNRLVESLRLREP
jgi:alpha-glucoside transport system permease protein